MEELHCKIWKSNTGILVYYSGNVNYLNINKKINQTVLIFKCTAGIKSFMKKLCSLSKYF